MSKGLVDFYLPILRDINNTRYSELASSTIIVFDYLLTLDQEIRYIWRARWTIGKVLFFANRYYTLFVVAFNNYGLHWFQWQGWTGLVSAALAEITLQLRLYALYYGNKKVLALMVCFFIAAMVSSAAVMGTTLSDVGATSTLFPGMKFCVPFNVSSHFYAFWIPILAFESLLCILACARGYKSYKDHEIRRLRDFRRRQRSSRQLDVTSSKDLNILEILLRDSVFYYIIIFSTYLTTTLMWIFGRITVLEIPVGFTVALSSVIANRLLLNLRGSRRSSSADAQNQMSSQSANAVSVSVGATTTMEDGYGREVSHELEVLRSMKASR